MSLSIFEKAAAVLSPALARVFCGGLQLIHDGESHEVVGYYNQNFQEMETGEDGIPVLTTKLCFEFENSTFGTLPMAARNDTIIKELKLYQVIDTRPVSMTWTRCFVQGAA